MHAFSLHIHITSSFINEIQNVATERLMLTCYGVLHSILSMHFPPLHAAAQTINTSIYIHSLCILNFLFMYEIDTICKSGSRTGLTQKHTLMHTVTLKYQIYRKSINCIGKGCKLCWQRLCIHMYLYVSITFKFRITVKSQVDGIS